jgi:hypothetical protein
VTGPLSDIESKSCWARRAPHLLGVAGRAAGLGGQPRTGGGPTGRITTLVNVVVCDETGTSHALGDTIAGNVEVKDTFDSVRIRNLSPHQDRVVPAEEGLPGPQRVAAARRVVVGVADHNLPAVRDRRFSSHLDCGEPGALGVHRWRRSRRRTRMRSSPAGCGTAGR